MLLKESAALPRSHETLEEASERSVSPCLFEPRHSSRFRRHRNPRRAQSSVPVTLARRRRTVTIDLRTIVLLIFIAVVIYAWREMRRPPRGRR
jgi:hypothetical protein